MLGTLLVTAVLTVVACAVGALVLVVPFLVGVDMAERRGYSTERWGALCLLGTGLGVAVAALVASKDLSTLLFLPALVLAWGAPAVLSLLAPGQRVGGPQGVHER